MFRLVLFTLVIWFIYRLKTNEKTGHVARMGDRGDIYHLEDIGVDGRIILKWIFKK